MAGKYEKQSQESKSPAIWGVIVAVLLLIVIVGIFVMRTPNAPADATLSKDVASSTEQEIDDVLLTKESLSPYLDVLGMESETGSIEASTEFIEGLSSVSIMGRTGSVMHGFTAESTVIIDSMEWVDNSSATREEFDSFISCLRKYFGKNEEAVKSYDTISEETYIWIDEQYNAYALCWYKNGKINMRWDSQKTQNQKVNRCIRCGAEIESGSSFCVSCLATPIDQIGSPAKKNEQTKPAQHTCEVSGCNQVGEYDIVGFSGKTEYYCKKHMLEMGEIVSDILFTNKYGTPTTICAHKGCTRTIASSGNTNCCTVHSNKCGGCGKYIDEDALFCIACIAKALY